MNKEKHPEYQDVLFVDTSTGDRFIIGSTLKPKQKEMYQGKEYPVCPVSISSASHPFFTGSKQFVDSEGRVDKFMKRYAKAAQPKKPAAVEEVKKSKGSK